MTNDIIDYINVVKPTIKTKSEKVWKEFSRKNPNVIELLKKVKHQIYFTDDTIAQTLLGSPIDQKNKSNVIVVLDWSGSSKLENFMKENDVNFHCMFPHFSAYMEDPKFIIKYPSHKKEFLRYLYKGRKENIIFLIKQKDLVEMSDETVPRYVMSCFDFTLSKWLYNMKSDKLLIYDDTIKAINRKQISLSRHMKRFYNDALYGRESVNLSELSTSLMSRIRNYTQLGMTADEDLLKVVFKLSEKV